MNQPVSLRDTPIGFIAKLRFWLENYFGIEGQGSTLRREIIAGATTFLAAAYVIVVNPDINSAAGIPFSAGVTATVLVSFLGTLAMALYAKNPILIAPGMGINILFAYTMVVGAKIPLQIALGCVLWGSVIFTVLAFFNVRQAVIDGIPASLRNAISCGMGLFIALIGLVNAKFISADPFTVVHAAPFNPIILTFLAGLMVGRTPEFLGKKIESFEIRMAALAVLLPCAGVLLGCAVSFATKACLSAIACSVSVPSGRRSGGL